MADGLFGYDSEEEGHAQEVRDASNELFKDKWDKTSLKWLQESNQKFETNFEEIGDIVDKFRQKYNQVNR